jgi:hypothetical protein
MKEEHKKVQNWIKKTYSGKYIIEAEVDEQNKLPDAARRWYQPDVIIKSKNGRIKWIEELPGVNCQERTRQELIETLRVTLEEEIEFNRQDAIASAGTGYSEEKIAVPA